MRLNMGHVFGFARKTCMCNDGKSFLFSASRTVALMCVLLAGTVLSCACAVAADQTIQKVEVESLSDSVQVIVTSSAPLSLHDNRISNRYITFDLYGKLAPKQAKRVSINSGEIRSVKWGWYRSSPPIVRVAVRTSDKRPYSVRYEDGQRRTIIEIAKAGSTHREERKVRSSDDVPAITPVLVPTSTEAEVRVKPQPILVASLTPVVTAARVAPQATVPKAKPKISLDFVASDIHDVLKALALQSGANVVAGPDVKGAVTVSLSDVTVDDALKLVTNLSGYKFANVEGSYVVGTQENIKALANAGDASVENRVSEVATIRYADPGLVSKILDKEYGMVQVTSSASENSGDAAKGLAFLVLTGGASDVRSAKAMIDRIEASVQATVDSLATELYEVKYADIDELAALLANSIPGLRVGKGPSQGFNLECPTAVAMGGSSDSGYSGGQSTSTQKVPPKVLILQGTQEEVDRARELLEKVDVQQPQILIEAQVLDITDDYSKDLGIKWDTQGQITGFSLSEEQDATHSLKFGRVWRSPLQFAGIVKALVDSEKAKVLAKPNVLALDGKPATIFIGDEVKYVVRVEQTPNGINVNVETARVGVQLLSVSRVSSDGYITMDLHPEVSVITGWINTAADLPLPEISRRFVDSTIRVKDGETIVIGGLIKDEDVESMSGIPILKDLPFIGSLFRTKSKDKVHSEIVMIITPRVLAST